jgi:hypothetical protein
MNRRSPGFLLVSQAGKSVLQYKTAEGLSSRAIYLGLVQVKFAASLMSPLPL